MTDWYFCGTFDATFWAKVNGKRLSGTRAAVVLRPLLVEACEADIGCLTKARLWMRCVVWNSPF
jgi:hypothetical protein